MISAALLDRLGPQLAAALEAKGYTQLTQVQEAVLDPALQGRDLRVSSQTGSGKTLAIGFILRDVLEKRPAREGAACPSAMVIAPTRELAKQVEAELSWLYAPLRLRVAAVTGGASYRDEYRALAAGPAIVVATPGRLIDHLQRNSIDTSAVRALALDEADRMLDMGFRDALEAIFERMPSERRTHLVSATFPREVQALANRVQHDPMHVEGTRLGAANVDIEHIVHLVDPEYFEAAIFNLLLADAEAQTLIFARTRADVAQLTTEFSHAGFPVSSLSGEMQQNARNRALESFKRGDTRVLIATDVAARGIDVQNITRVIQVEVPHSADDYTHRSGRTGRAGRKGVSILLLAPQRMQRALRILQRAGVQFRFDAVPTPESIRKEREARLLRELHAPEDEAGQKIGKRFKAMAERLMAEGDVEAILARLLQRLEQDGLPDPRYVRPIRPPADLKRLLQPAAPSKKPTRFGAPSQGRFQRGGRGKFEGESRGRGGRFEERGAPKGFAQAPKEESPARSTARSRGGPASVGERRGGEGARSAPRATSGKSPYAPRTTPASKSGKAPAKKAAKKRT